MLPFWQQKCCIWACSGSLYHYFARYNYTGRWPNLANARVLTVGCDISGLSCVWNVSKWRIYTYSFFKKFPRRDITIYRRNMCIGEIWYLAILGRRPVTIWCREVYMPWWALQDLQEKLSLWFLISFWIALYKCVFNDILAIIGTHYKLPFESCMLS